MKTTKVTLRFKKSDRNDSMIAFITESKNGTIRGVSENAKCPKKIALPGKELGITPISGVLYEAGVIPMKGGARGYVVMEIEPIQFEAHMEVIHVKKALYQIKVTWGNQEVLFDPKDGRRDSVKNPHQIANYLRGRVDIENAEFVADEFRKSAGSMIQQMSKDGLVIF